MSEFQICMCGTAPGYPHNPCCPRPCYSERTDDNWIYAWAENLRNTLDASGKHTSQVMHENARLRSEVVTLKLALEELRNKTRAVQFQHKQGEML